MGLGNGVKLCIGTGNAIRLNGWRLERSTRPLASRKYGGGEGVASFGGVWKVVREATDKLGV